MFWLAKEPVSYTASVRWRREEHPSAESRAAGSGSALEPASEVEETLVEGALWRQVGKLHYLSYLEPAEENEGTVVEEAIRAKGDRTTLKLEPARLTLIRQGSLQWNPVFEAGVLHRSALVLGSGSLPAATRTMALAIDIRPEGGHILVEYELVMGDWPQQVRLQIDFTRTG